MLQKFTSATMNQSVNYGLHVKVLHKVLLLVCLRYIGNLFGFPYQNVLSIQTYLWKKNQKTSPYQNLKIRSSGNTHTHLSLISIKEKFLLLQHGIKLKKT